jgi:hypothetical protein
MESTRNVQHQNSDLFSIQYEKASSQQVSVESANQIEMFLQYQPQKILAKDLELFLHYF